MKLADITKELGLLRDYREVLRNIYDRGPQLEKDLCVALLLDRCNKRIQFLEEVMYNCEAEDSYDQNTGVYSREKH